jgi:hypothetical protein
MNYLYVKYKHYIDFVNEYKNDRLCKNLKIYATTKNGIINEIFNEPLYTNYKIEKNTLDYILISFETKSNYKYRLDIFKIIELDKYNNYINHIAFSDYNNDISDENKYEELLHRNEMYEIINKIHFVLKDLINNNILDNYFCIGGTKLMSKNNIYQYVLKILVGEEGFKKLDTEVYKDTKFGLYFKI